ncbi:MAG: SDR family oxidoreductase [Bacteroidia bacterium]
MYEQNFHNEDISSKSFLVTGGAGFIGSNIVEYLLKYSAGKVRVLDNLSEGLRENVDMFLNHPNYEFVEGSITDYATCLKNCEGIDYVLHQAALGSVPRSIKNPVATNEANVTGFLNMLTAAKDSGVKRFVYASSSSVYGDSPDLPKREEKIGKPLSPYAVSKLVDEFYADVFARTYNMQVIGLRYFNIFGTRQKPDGPYAAAIPLFMDALLNNKSPFINGDGEQTRDFTFVENAVQANIRALFTNVEGATGQVYNVAVAERISINLLFNTLKNLTASEILPTYREEREGDIRNSLADISKAQKYLEYKPTTKVEKGLEITLNWFKTRKPVSPRA